MERQEGDFPAHGTKEKENRHRRHPGVDLVDVAKALANQLHMQDSGHKWHILLLNQEPSIEMNWSADVLKDFVLTVASLAISVTNVP